MGSNLRTILKTDRFVSNYLVWNETTMKNFKLVEDGFIIAVISQTIVFDWWNLNKCEGCVMNIVYNLIWTALIIYMGKHLFQQKFVGNLLANLHFSILFIHSDDVSVINIITQICNIMIFSFNSWK